MRLLLPLVIPLIAAAAVALLRDRPQVRDWAAILAGVAELLALAVILPDVLDGVGATFNIAPFLPDAPIALRGGPLGMLLLLTASPLWLLTTLYSIGYLRGPAAALTRLHVLMAITISATAGVAFSANLITLYLFYEVMTIATYPLVSFARTNEAAAGDVATSRTSSEPVSPSFCLPSP